MPLITSSKGIADYEGSGDVNNLSPAPKPKPLQYGIFQCQNASSQLFPARIMDKTYINKITSYIL
jgi:hypothetical protein